MNHKSSKLRIIFGLDKRSPLELAYGDHANMLVAKWISLVLGLFGFGVLISSLIIPVPQNDSRYLLFSSEYWKIIHRCLYLVLIAGSLFTFLFATIYLLKEREPTKKTHLKASSCIFIFLLIVNLFGVVISTMDYQSGGQVTAFITTLIVTYSAFRIHPIKAIITMTSLFALFFSLILFVPLFDPNLYPEFVRVVDYRLIIDFTILYCLTLVVSFHVYHMTLKAAKNSITLNHVNTELKEISCIDSLTKLGNRLQLKTQQHSYYNKNIIILMIDFNDFKKFNEKFGYHVGDQVFKKYTKILTNTFTNAVVYRWDNDQFLIVSYDSLYDLKKKMEIYRTNMNSFSYQGLKTGFSSGYAFSFVATKEEFESLIKKAEYQLFVDKLDYKKKMAENYSEQYYSTSY